MLVENLPFVSKISMFVIGKWAKPPCFKNITHLPCSYRSQSYFLSLNTTSKLHLNDEEIQENILTKDAEEMVEILLQNDVEPEKPTKAETHQALETLETWNLFEEESVASHMRKNLHSYSLINLCSSLQEKQTLQSCLMHCKFSWLKHGALITVLFTFLFTHFISY